MQITRRSRFQRVIPRGLVAREEEKLRAQIKGLSFDERLESIEKFLKEATGEVCRVVFDHGPEEEYLGGPFSGENGRWNRHSFKAFGVISVLKSAIWNVENRQFFDFPIPNEPNRRFKGWNHTKCLKKDSQNRVAKGHLGKEHRDFRDPEVPGLFQHKNGGRRMWIS